MKKFSYLVLGVSVVTLSLFVIHAQAKSDPVSPVWKYSFETELLGTPDGNIHPGQYAILPNGKYLINSATTSVADIGQIKEVANTINVSGMTQVPYLGKQYINVFDNAGIEVRSRGTAAAYKALAQPKSSAPLFAPTSTI